MRMSVLLLSLLVIGCERSPNSFTVHAPGAVSAELRLCGEAVGLARSGDTLSVTHAIRCEGEGTIAVHFPDRPSASCHIGYVTPGAVQNFRFKVDGDRCVPL